MHPAVQTSFRSSVSNFSIVKVDSVTKAVICECDCTGSLRLPVPKEAILTRILVVDDDPMVCIAIEVCLRKPFTPAALLAVVNDCLNKPKVSAHRQ